MILLQGMAMIGGLGLLLLAGGYTVAGFLPDESRLSRLAVAVLAGLGWLILGTSAWGAWRPLDGSASVLLAIPTLAAGLIPAARRQLRADLSSALRSPRGQAAAAGWLLLGGSLLLPFLVYPDLVFYDGKANHDNFFWCSAAEYLQAHPYLSAAPPQDRNHPFYNLVGAILGWHPVWGRMGAEGFLAVIASAVRRSPVEICNGAAGALTLPWVLTVLAVARRLGLPPLNRILLLLVCACQPLLIFYVANGNLPNLLGAIFGGGLWLLALLVAAGGPRRSWPLLVAGALCAHGLLCCYPEIVPFALLPVCLLTLWRAGRRAATAAPAGLWMSTSLLAGCAVNPLTTCRAWTGFWSSVDSARLDSSWANVFAKLNAAEYVPGLVTLAAPGVQLYGWLGGILATGVILASAAQLWRQSPKADLLLISLSGFVSLLLYTALTSFSYGWQKSVQFSGIPLAVVFPVLLAGQAQDALRAGRPRRLALAWLAGALAIVVHGAIAQAEDNLKWAGRKGLTRGLIGWRDHVARDFPDEPVYCDDATFHFPFFHGMWSARIFAGNPLHFLPGQNPPGGYLQATVNPPAPEQPGSAAIYYVSTDWTRAFDYPGTPLALDRVGSLVRRHNRVTAMRGFYRTSGVPEWAEPRFTLTVVPWADGWLEFTLRPNGAAGAGCRLRGRATTDDRTESLEAELDARQRIVVRFPLKAGVKNRLEAQIAGAPVVDSPEDDPQFPFEVIAIRAVPAAP